MHGLHMQTLNIWPKLTKNMAKNAPNFVLFHMASTRAAAEQVQWPEPEQNREKGRNLTEPERNYSSAAALASTPSKVDWCFKNMVIPYKFGNVETLAFLPILVHPK
jgi:hypothetical protein